MPQTFSNRKRCGQIMIRLHEWERTAIRESADAAGLSLSEYIRRVTLADAQRRLTGTATDADAR